MYIREAAVSGYFYPSNKSKLLKMIEGFIQPTEEKLMAKAVIAPHAGYIYSGHVAGAIYSAVSIPENIILIGPNHTGFGKPFSIMKEGQWESPFGHVPINSALAELIIARFPKLEDDYYAHIKEHSLEVQLPFLQFFNKNVNIVPITLMGSNYKTLNLLGLAIADAVKIFQKDVLIVISSDMSHYISHEEALKRDKKAIEKIIALDEEGLLEVCETFDISMCGIYPAIVGISAAKALGAKEGKLIKYATSGEVSKDYDHVVGYAGIAIV